MGNKGKWKNGMLKSHLGVDHVGINEKIQRNKQKNSGQLVTVLLHPTYDVDFSSKIFGQIRMKKLLNPTPPEYIKNFFSDFDRIKNIVITVKDVENPRLDKKSLIVLEFGNFKRQLTVSLFRALLPKEIKNIYEQKYDKDCENSHYKRLEDLLLYGADKEIEVEEH